MGSRSWAEPYNSWSADWPKTTRFDPCSRHARVRNVKGHECPFAVLACECHALLPARVLVHVHGACLRVPCPCLRVRCAFACLPCLSCFHTLGAGVLLWNGISMMGVFKGAPVRWRGRPAVLPAIVVSFSGYRGTDLGAAVTIPQIQLPPHIMAFSSTTKSMYIYIYVYVYI